MKEIVVSVAFKTKYPTKNYTVRLDEDTYAILQFELYKAKICNPGEKLKRSVAVSQYPSLKAFITSINKKIFSDAVLFELEYEREKMLFEYTERLYSDSRVPEADIEKYRLEFFKSPTVAYTEKLFIKDFAQRYGGVVEIISI